MDTIKNTLVLGLLKEIISIFNEASPYLLFGFLIAGFLHIYLQPDFIAKHLGQGKIKPVLLAALFGVPLPLCSCGVIPAALALDKKGANKGAVLSFLISTPQSGVDSIALTYALIDLPMTIIRPIAAFLTAAAAGIITNFTEKDHKKNNLSPEACVIDDCCKVEECPPEEHKHHHSFLEKIRFGLRFAFVDLLADIAQWLLIGIILAGIISYFIPVSFITQHLSGGIFSMLIMLAAGIPLYICAAASTPIAAALIAKGVSPGTALVFLLSGPATNIATILVIGKTLGKKATALYLGSIAVCSIGLGIFVDYLYFYFMIVPATSIVSHEHGSGVILKSMASGILFVLIIVALYKEWKTKRNAVTQSRHH